MARVSYVCVSDLHLGADTAILTDTPAVRGHVPFHSADPLRAALAHALGATLAALDEKGAEPAKPRLVLLGDILDLSLGTPDDAVKSFRQLLSALEPLRKRLGPMVFLPGNHDHELWTVSRFSALGLDGVSAAGSHTTPAFARPEEMPTAGVLDPILRSMSFEGCTTFYPNMGLLSADGQKAVILHHGHFVESIYRIMSTLAEALDGTTHKHHDVQTLEEENSSWIDFFWSNFGDNGTFGREARLSYDYLLTGREDVRFDRRLAKVLSEKLIATLPVPQTAVAHDWARAAVNAMIEATVGAYGQLDRFSYFSPLGADATQGLRSYLSYTVPAQFAAENPPVDKARPGATAPAGTGGRTMPADVTFIFGHTHKSFETRFPVPGYAVPPAVYNTGGWDLDMPMFGTLIGASAVFIDEDLNVASLRLCGVPEGEGQSSAPVSVSTADGRIAGNPLAERLENALNHASTEWAHFTTQATKAYRAKQAYLFATLAAQDKSAKHDGSTF